MTNQILRNMFFGIFAVAAVLVPTGTSLWAADMATPRKPKETDDSAISEREQFTRNLPPYNHVYHQCLTYKIYCADKQYPDQSVVTFEEALRYIRVIHDVTDGLKQIVYLVGWQFDGHDSKYPAWSEVNHRLKRPQDPDARTSFLWLAEEAKKYNALVSVHINMSDAYETSPLWNEYRANGLIVCDKEGNPCRGGIWGGEVSYHVDKVREWKSGYAQKRINALVKLLPFLRESGTVHIDAFGIIGKNDALRQTVNAIFDYWRSLGIDVTTEYFDFALAGWLPMVYHLNLSEESRLEYPPSVVCGGGDGGNQRIRKTYRCWERLPEAGCLYEEAWGISIDRALRPKRGGTQGIVGRICTKTLPWYFLNRHRAVSYVDGEEVYRVVFSDDVESTVRKADRYLTIRQGGRTLVDGGDVFMPALWTDGQWFAYNRKGGTRVWAVPEEWKNAKTLNTVALTDDGRGEKSTLPVLDGKITITLQAGEGLALSR